MVKRIKVKTAEQYLGFKIDKEIFNVQRGIFQTDGGRTTRDYDYSLRENGLAIIGHTSSKTYWGYKR